MGGVEDDEPPSKRVKVSSGKLRDLPESTSVRGLVTCCNTMGRTLPSEGDEEIIGSKGIIKKGEFVRIIAEALHSLGYKKSLKLLEEESGIALHSPIVNLFIQQILDGNWDESVDTLHKIGLLDDSTIKLASFTIFEHKFFELLYKGKLVDALKTLRSEIAPLSVKANRVRELSMCLLSPSQNSLVGYPGLDVAREKSRSQLLEELKNFLPPTLIIPERRLECLVEQALSLQKNKCVYHNSLDEDMSLLIDHQCGTENIPSHPLQVLEKHDGEVWFLRFSHNGNYLASSSSDRSIIIWEVKPEGTISFKCRLSGHKKPVSYVSWSPDDSQLLTCGVEEVVRRWEVSSGKCLNTFEKSGLGLVSCGWSPDGKGVFSGITDKSICLWDLNGKEVECWKGQRTVKISDLEVTHSGKFLFSMCRENTILILDIEKKMEKFVVEDQFITSFSLSMDDKFLLLSLLNQEIHLWNINGDPKLVARYKGHERSRFIVRSCFGGLGQAFIASGSEDSQVYIWHKNSGELVEKLSGHSGAVNCVSWNPANPHMLASASDDHTIRIWGLKKRHSFHLKHDQKAHSNGTVSYGNGKT